MYITSLIFSAILLITGTTTLLPHCLYALAIKSILKFGERLGRHKGIFESVCSVIVYAASPGIHLAAIGYSITRTRSFTFTASIAYMRLGYGSFIKLCIGNDKAVSDKRTELIGKECTVKSQLTETYENSRRIGSIFLSSAARYTYECFSSP